jgi:hypothetical protein
MGHDHGFNGRKLKGGSGLFVGISSLLLGQGGRKIRVTYARRVPHALHIAFRSRNLKLRDEENRNSSNLATGDSFYVRKNTYLWDSGAARRAE